MTNPIFVAIDTPYLDDALELTRRIRGQVGGIKLGLEFFCANGHHGVHEVQKLGLPIFLDLKLHDIPNTVSAAVTSVAHLSPKFLTIHASGGSAMIKAASEAAPDISITAVTILTSLSDDDLKEIGYAQDSANSAAALAKLASQNGARSIVCSPFEASKIRNVVGSKVEIITPGVRPEGAELGDQKRVMTPREAMTSGANYLVIGRPITDQSKISLDSMKKISASILDSLN